MKTVQILQHIVTLTEQETVRDLKTVFAGTIASLIGKPPPIIYEIHEIRDSESDKKENSTIAVDSLDYSSSFIYIDEICGLKEVVEKGEIAKIPEAPRYQLLLPIKEKNSVTNVVVYEKIPDDEFFIVLKQIVSVFANNLYLLNVKDRDHLTSFYNRQAYNRMINPILFHSNRKEIYVEQKKSFTFLGIIDIDHFKEVNDVYGHLMGDEVLILFSQIIKNTFRHDDLIFRYGGEEFVIIIKDINLQYAKSVFERCRKNVEKYEFPQVGRITVSIGYTSITGSGDPLAVLDKADRALYYSKENGRNKCSFYEDLIRNRKIDPVIETGKGVEYWD